MWDKEHPWVVGSLGNHMVAVDKGDVAVAGDIHQVVDSIVDAVAGQGLGL